MTRNTQDQKHPKMEKKMEKSRVLSRTCLVATLSLVFSAMTTPVLADPTGKWTTGAPIPVAVEGYGAAQVGNIHYYMGGFSAGDTMLNQRYDKSTDTWLTNGAPVPSPRGETAAVATGGFVYLVGGRCPLACNLLQRYDPASDTWTTLSPLPVPVDSEHVVAVHDGKIYVAGGRTVTVPIGFGAVAVLQIYDIASDTWSMGAPLPTPLGLADSAAIAQGSRIYVFGGGFAGTGLPTTLIYDIPSDSWSFGTPMPTARADASVGGCGNKLHVIGGAVTVGVFVAAHEVYNPVTDTWSVATPIPGGATGAGTEVQAVSQGGRIYIVGGGIFGSGGANPVQNIWKCADPVKGTVTSNGQPSPDTTVQLFNAVTQELAGTSTTDETGFFLFDVDPGVYLLTVTTATGTSTVIITVLPGIDLVQDLAT